MKRLNKRCEVGVSSKSIIDLVCLRDLRNRAEVSSLSKPSDELSTHRLGMAFDGRFLFFASLGYPAPLFLSAGLDGIGRVDCVVA